MKKVILTDEQLKERELSKILKIIESHKPLFDKLAK